MSSLSPPFAASFPSRPEGPVAGASMQASVARHNQASINGIHPSAWAAPPQLIHQYVGLFMLEFVLC